jgi:hypothetical protein
MIAKHDFTPLFRHYPNVIAEMPATFTSHQFILRLAQRYQVEYIEALYHYRTNLRLGKPAPFMMLHGILAQHLQDCQGLVTKIASLVPSTDIFGEDQQCAQWQKL